VRRARDGFVVLFALCMILAAKPVFGAPDVSTASRIVDRTLVCRVGFSNGARLVEITAQSAARNGDALFWLAQADVATPGNPVSKKDSTPTLAGVTAGWPPPPPLTSGALGYENTRCGATTKAVPLSRRSLVGGVAGTFGDDVRCIVPRMVLVRVRATFREPVTEEPNRAGGFITASGRIVTGQIAVRTLAGRQVAYADVTESGRARIFSRGCL
jgi:hypothetical protein